MSARRQSFVNTDDVSTDEFEPPQSHELIRSAPSNNPRSGAAPQQERPRTAPNNNNNNNNEGSTGKVIPVVFEAK